MTAITEPRVELIAHTTLACDGRSPAIEGYMSLDPDAGDMQQLVEFAGRACYQSFHKPNPATARNADYIARTLHGQKHWSIAEHATATFYITGVSRALTHELIRHRHLSYSQLSQRFVDESEANIVIPPAVRKAKAEEVSRSGESLGSVRSRTLEEYYDGLRSRLPDALEETAGVALWDYGVYVKALTAGGLSRKQAREAARAVLPNMVETRIVVTGNLRAWHEVIARRTAPDADAEFQEVAGLIRKELQRLAPEVFPEP